MVGGTPLPPGVKIELRYLNHKDKIETTGCANIANQETPLY